MSERTAPFYCPYCGEEQLRPSPEGHGVWECLSCVRAFRLAFLGLLARGHLRHAADGDRGIEQSDSNPEGSLHDHRTRP